MIKRQLQAGFTLMEILIVMIIIALLASLSASNFQSSQRKARDSRRRSDLHQIANALETYYNDVGSYPLNSADNEIAGCNGAGDVCPWGSSFFDDKGTVYMVKLPADPAQENRGYHYVYLSDGTSYQLYARFENTEDSAVVKVNDVPQVYGNLDCGEVGCNYGIASSNSHPTEGNALTDE